MRLLLNSIVVLLWILSAIWLYHDNYKPAIDILKDSSFIIQPLSDSLENGQSECHIITKNKSIEIKSIRRSGYESPYTGIIFQLKDKSYLNMVNYTISASFESNQECSLPITLYCFQPEITKKSNILSYRIITSNSVIRKGLNTLQIPVGSIVNTPDWWFVKNKIKEDQIPSCTPNKVLNFRILTAKGIPLNTLHTLILHKMELKMDYTVLYKDISVLSVIAFILLIVINFFKKIKQRIIHSNKETTILMPLLPSELSPDAVSLNTAKILQYLAEHYGKPAMTVQIVASDLGIHERTVSKLIKEYSDMNFKTYLNNLRLEESKRLLRNTTLTISEISFKIGYNSPQSYNRVFKETYNTSPTEFRNLN